MTFENYQHAFTKKANKAGYSENNIQKCLEYAKPLVDRNLPVIYNTSHLSALVGYKRSYIKKAVLYPSYFYRTFRILKRNGNQRTLQEPLPSLKEIQDWILVNLLYEIPINRFAKAYIPNRNLIDNVKYHRNKQVVVSLDIQDFFSSISRNSIENIFLRIGYSSNISNLISKLCTLNDSLPQGASTSPYLSNIFLNDFDIIVSTFARLNNIRYTRYADDLTFSGDIENTASLIDFIEFELARLQLRLNKDKVKVMGQNVRQLVTGIVVNSVVQAPKKYRDKIRQEVYYIRKYGVDIHLKNTHNNKGNYLNHLIGKINFVLYVNKEDKEMKNYKAYLLHILEEQK